MASKFVKNTTGSPITLNEVGVTIPASSTFTIPPEHHRMWAADDAITEITPYINSGDIVINDGHEDLIIAEAIYYLKWPDQCWNIRFQTEDRRSNGFPDNLDTAQEAIEYSKSGAIENDLDSMQFGRASVIASDTWLYNIFQIPSNNSPSGLGYDIKFRRITFFGSNNAASFNIKVYKFAPNSNPKLAVNQILIYTFNASGYGGYSPEQNIDVDQGYGIGVYIESPASGVKPSNLNVRVLIRQR